MGRTQNDETKRAEGRGLQMGEKILYARETAGSPDETNQLSFTARCTSIFQGPGT